MFSVIVPLEFHRGGALRCIEAWLRQTLDGPLYEIVLVVPPSFDRRELAELESRLRPDDQVVSSSQRHDIPLVAEGARRAKGDFLFFTESHVWPEPDVLEECKSAFDENPHLSAFSCRAVRITHDRMARADAAMYEADIEYGMNVHPWRKILDQCFVCRRDAYFACDGFDEELGHFSEWTLAATFHARGYRIGYMPSILVHHQYSGRLDELCEFTRDFILGEFKFLSSPRDDAVTDLVDTPVEWDCRGNWSTSSAAELCRLAVSGLVHGRVLGTRVAIRLAFRWLIVLLTGPLAARLTALLNEIRRLAAVRLISRLGSQQRLDEAFRAYISAVIHAQRVRCVSNTLKGWGARRAPAQLLGGICEWHPRVRGAFDVAGFHPIERRDGVVFRWSEPIAMIGVELPAGTYGLSVEFLEIDGVFSAAGIEIFHNRQRVRVEELPAESRRISASIDVPLSGRSQVAWRCRQVQAPRDPRRLGVPVTKVTWRRAEGP